MSIESDGFGTVFKTGEGGGGGGASGGAEYLTAADPGDQGSLSISVQVSVLVNTSGGSAIWDLPDGTDGLIKEIVSGTPGTQSVNFIGVRSTNAAYGGNDLLDFGNYTSVRLVWITAAGGWVSISVCTNTNSAWD